MPEWLVEFPKMDRDALRSLSKAIDEGYRGFSRAYGEGIEDFFDPLLFALVWFEKLLLGAPWLLVLVILGLAAWFAARSLRLTAGVLIAFLAIGYLGMWEDTMRTLAIICVCTLIAVLIGIPVGIAMARSERTQSLVTPVLDVMQTLPIFVYVIAVVIYAIPPVIRLTNLGLRLVDSDVLEAADAFGASPRQRLLGVQLPLALPNIMAGVNQTIMMALSMVVIASMIGVKGLGQPVLRAVTNQYFALGLFAGGAVVALAIVFDRTSQGYAMRLQKFRQS